MREVDSNLGGEQSGHIILSDYLKSGDGLLSTIKILDILTSKNKKASEIFDLYQDIPQVKLNIKVEDKNISFYENKDLQKFINEFTSHYKNIRLLVRPSGTESLIRILVEGDDLKKLNEISLEVESIIKG